MKKIFKNKMIQDFFIVFISLFSIEIIFKMIEKMSVFEWSTLRILIGSLITSLIISTIMSFCNKIIKNIILFLIIIIASIYATIQIGFENFLGVYVSISTSSQLGAVTEYVRDYLGSFHAYYYLVLIPLVLLIIYKISMTFIFKKDNKEINIVKKPWISRAVFLCLSIILCVGYYISLSISFMQNDIQMIATKSLFENPSNPNIAVNQFGVEMFGILDVKTALFPPSESNNEVLFNKSNNNGNVISDYSRIIDDTAWNKVADNTTNNNFKTLNSYFMSRDITQKNEYTGMFEGKNLIVVMMESVDNILLNEEYYPNFAKLMNNGYYFENAYSPRNSCSTGNNEMTGMTSLFSIYRTCTANVYKTNKYEQSIFGLFNAKDYTTTSYHNYTEKYYYRSSIHKNMGSSKYYGVTDLNIKYEEAYKEWPSDVELIQKSSEIFTQNDPFMAWITTVSPHQPYYSDSELSKIYYNDFASTGYPSNLKRYMSKLKVMDDSLGELINILEQKDILDDTVIVLFADHYPYGLTNNEIKNALDDNINSYNEVDRTPFLIYNSSLEAKTFSQYTSYLNILPTVANLFNLDYDPRFYMGTDLLSESYEDQVIFADGSWQTPVGFYNSSTGRMSYFTDKQYTNEEIVSKNTEISNMIKYSNLAISTNYFDYLNTEMKKYAKTEVVKDITVDVPNE